MFFDQEYEFKGKHAKYVDELCNVVFRRYIDVLILAPVVGLIYNRRAELDNSPEKPKSIFAEQMNKEKDKILFNYRLCMLLNDEYSKEDKIDNAFKYYVEDVGEPLQRFKENINLYNSYIRGGVEILYETLLDGNKEFNGKIDEHYQKTIFKKVTEFIADYMEEVDEMNKIDNEIEEI